MATLFVFSFLVFLVGNQANANVTTHLTSTTSPSQSPSFMQCGWDRLPRYLIFRVTLFDTTEEQHTIWANHLRHLRNESKNQNQVFYKWPLFRVSFGKLWFRFSSNTDYVPTLFYMLQKQINLSQFYRCMWLWALLNWIEPFSLLKFNWTKAFACRYKHFWANDHKTITYDRSKSLKVK